MGIGRTTSTLAVGCLPTAMGIKFTARSMGFKHCLDIEHKMPIAARFFCIQSGVPPYIQRLCSRMHHRKPSSRSCRDRRERSTVSPTRFNGYTQYCTVKSRPGKVPSRGPVTPVGVEYGRLESETREKSESFYLLSFSLTLTYSPTRYPGTRVQYPRHSRNEC